MKAQLIAAGLSALFATACTWAFLYLQGHGLLATASAFPSVAGSFMIFAVTAALGVLVISSLSAFSSRKERSRLVRLRKSLEEAASGAENKGQFRSSHP